MNSSTCLKPWHRHISQGDFFACLLVVVIAVMICAGNGSAKDRVEKRYRHKKLGYTIPYLDRAEEEAGINWKRIRVADADLAFRAEDRSHAAISSRCEVPETELRILARHLVIGLEERVRVRAENFEFAQGAAYSQVFDAVVAEAPVHAKTVTWFRAGCVVDWYLVTTGSLVEVEPAFDSWWRAFDPGEIPAAPQAAASAETPAESRPGVSP
jgi:hypothetical protein